MKLRPYQQQATTAVFNHLTKNKWQNTVVAAPTGSGKSHMIADVVHESKKRWQVQTLILSHQKEILKQNFEKLEHLIKSPIGLYSAGLSSRTIKDVTVAGIQSVWRHPSLFKDVKLIITDEAHLISTEEDTMYRKFFDGLNQHVIVGYTATPFRTGTGLIYGKDKFFVNCAYDLTSKENYQKLVDEGYLARLVTKETHVKMDVEGVRITGGDFNEKDLAKKNDRAELTNAIIDEIIQRGSDRNKWLLFAIDINHAEHIAERLISKGISAFVVHSKSEFNNDNVIKMFRDSKFRALVNVGMLTTGFDDPAIDLIGGLRPSQSPIFHVQTNGRGARPFYAKGMPLDTIQERLAAIDASVKKNCLVLDFGGNTARLGPINDVILKIKGKGAKTGDPVTKTCPQCSSILAPAVRKCPDCGFKFEFQVKLTQTASRLAIVAEKKESKLLDVNAVMYSVYKKVGSPSMVKVTYNCGLANIHEFVCIEHHGWAGDKARHWVKMRGGKPCATVDDLMDQKELLKVPKSIFVDRQGKYPVIKDYLGL